MTGTQGRETGAQESGTVGTVGRGEADSGVWDAPIWALVTKYAGNVAKYLRKMINFANLCVAMRVC